MATRKLSLARKNILCDAQAEKEQATKGTQKPKPNFNTLRAQKLMQLIKEKYPQASNEFLLMEFYKQLRIGEKRLKEPRG